MSDIRNEKMELMINIDGICNDLKGKTRLNRYSFGLDIRKLALGVFLTEVKLLIRDRIFQKSDIIVLYDDTTLRTGNRGFAITKDEIISNISGIFHVIHFSDFDAEVEYLLGPKKDVIRLHFNDVSFDLKVRKNTTYTSVVLDIISLLHQYAIIEKNEEKNNTLMSVIFISFFHYPIVKLTV